MKTLLLFLCAFTSTLRAYAPYDIQKPTQTIEQVLKIGEKALSENIQSKKTKNPHILLDFKDFQALEIKYITESGSEDKFCWLIKYANPPAINMEIFIIVSNDGAYKTKRELRY